MKPKIALDSSLLIALYNPKDSQNRKAKNIYRKVSNHTNVLILHPLILIETLTVLKRKIDMKELKQFEAVLFDSNIFTHEPEFVSVSETGDYLSLFNQDNNLSLADCVLLSFCIENGCALLTFDKKLETVYKRTKALINKLN